ncbi:DUF520 family protein [Ideonella azotifigens]|uniref:DUF520 family protein n=1 Tax=Ideonella azotifigens TaxID=513160 RepID=UPI0011415F9C|nr:DUF520 family protein [Ideonella azotifigens]MCD2343537.1 DUF520 family protein [Ideonella azotifigens]
MILATRNSWRLLLPADKFPRKSRATSCVTGKNRDDLQAAIAQLKQDLNDQPLRQENLLDRALAGKCRPGSLAARRLSACSQSLGREGQGSQFTLAGSEQFDLG